ncbi:MAG: zinc-dependent metalloprotease family protein [Bacteroidota bacterium]
MKKSITLWCLLGLLSTLSAQGPPFIPFNFGEGNFDRNQERRVVPDQAKLYQLAPAAMQAYLRAAPHQNLDQTTDYLLEIPDPTGQSCRFKILRYDIMEAPLADNHPDIVTLLGIDVDQPGRKIRLDWTDHGFHASVSGDPAGRWYVEPLYWQQMDLYQVFYTRDYPRQVGLDRTCKLHEVLEETHANSQEEAERIGDCQLREYRLALATTGEYSAFHGGTVASVGAELVTAINRVNQVFEADLSVRLLLIANNDLLINLNAGTDPYTNNSGATMLGENQTEVDMVIGSANYDVGHVFSTGGGGIAGLGVVCLMNSKARGVTGLGSPTGDPFYIDFVAHELGHQFGGNHSFNSENGNCMQRNGSTAYEPGGGTTIQAYAGICGPVSNIQLNSDPYYHTVSLQEMSTYLQGGTGNNCASVNNMLNNTAPVVSAGPDFLIPINTAFNLTATGSDANGDALTYCWEQFDLGSALDGEPTGFEASAPIMRSLPPTISPVRTVDGSIAWEALPQVARVYTFMVTARDVNTTYGCPVRDQMTVTTVAGTGPFAVITPNGGESLVADATTPISWNVGGSDDNGIDCSEVIIELSLDGGQTWGNAVTTDNDGSFDFPLPDVAESDARIRISCADNIFFDISDANFTIVREDFSLTVTTATTTICSGTNSAMGLGLDLESLLSYTGNVSLTAVGLPGGVTASFAPGSPVNLMANATESVATTLNNTGGLAPGTYSFTIEASDANRTKVGNFTLVVEAQVSSGSTLMSPANGGLLPVDAASFSWSAVPNATDYRIEICQGPGGSGGCSFATISNNAVNFGSNLVPPFSDGQTVFWTVTAFNGNCGTFMDGLSSTEFSFTFGSIPGASLSTPDDKQTICEGDQAGEFLLNFMDGMLNGPATLSTQSGPMGLMVAYSPNPISDGQQAIMTLTGEENLSPGDYTITVEADDGVRQETLDFTLTVQGDDIPNLIPMDGQEILIQGGNGVVSFSYDAVPNATAYFINIDGFQPFDNGTDLSVNLNLGAANDGDMFSYTVTAVTPGGDVFSCSRSFTFVNVLPVEWLDFRASAQGLTAQLNWEVIQDGLGRDYQLERRQTNTRNFRPIGNIADNGMLGITNYQYLDPGLQKGQTYLYRILQRDQDGRATYSPIRSLTIDAEVRDALLVPNPANVSTDLIVAEASNAQRYRLIDGLGRVVREAPVISSRTTIDLEGLPRAVYQLIVLEGGSQQILRLVKH